MVKENDNYNNNMTTKNKYPFKKTSYMLYINNLGQIWVDRLFSSKNINFQLRVIIALNSMACP